MTTTRLAPEQLSLRIDPASLGFDDTSTLPTGALPWIGQERADRLNDLSHARTIAQVSERLQLPAT